MFLVPFTRNTELARSFDRLFDDPFERFFGLSPATAEGPRSPALDVTESDSGYTVKLDMPGVTKEDLQVSVEGQRVSIEAETSRQEDKKDGDRVVYRERSMQRFARSFTLPQAVSASDARAKLDNGVLTLTLPKAVARAASKIAIG